MNILMVNRGSKLPVTNYGGTERVIWGLAIELHKQNHKVTLLSPRGSYCNFAEVIEYNPLLPVDDQVPENIDLVHLHFRPIKAIRKPYVITMHGNCMYDETLDMNTVFLTKDHANRHHSETYVYNGLDWDDYPKASINNLRTHFHFLGKASWKIKNLQGACEIARKTNQKLKVLGGEKWTYTNFKRGFKHLFNPNIQYLGMVDNLVKSKIISTSKELLFPVQWHEPFGLAIIESFYYGSPVFGTTYGSLKEIVKPEVGYTHNDITVIAKATQDLEFSAKACHDYALDCFNSETMTNNYLKLYEKVLNNKQLNEKEPFHKFNTAPLQ